LGELDVDTRSDIYSLGVLLYELLTSTTPFDGEKLRSSAYDEMLKTIRETEPPKPSTRLNTLGDALTDVAKHRHAEPSELCKILRGDLDWIVMKTLEKDRSRRYETANELAMDIERHLGDEPVSAGPPSTVYRLRKFGRRHRRGVMFSLLVAVALLTGLCLATIGFVQANRQRNIAETQRRRAGINFQMARDAVDEMTRVVEQQLVNVSGTEQVRRELLQKAQVFYAGFAEANRDDEVVRQEIALAYQRVGVIHNHLGNFRQARKALDEAITLFESLTAEFPNVPDYREALATCWSWHAHTFIWTDRQQEMVQGRRKVVALFQKLVADFPTAVGYRASLASAHTDVGNALKMTSQPEEAEMHFRQSLHIWRKLHTDFPEMPKDLEALAHSHHWLGAYLLDFGRLAEAEKELLVALELREQLLAEDPNSAWGRERLAHIKSYVGELLTRQGKVEEAEQEFREAIAIREKLIEEFPSHIEHRRRLAVLLSRLSKALMHGGRNQEAEDALRQAIARRENLAIDFPDVAGFRYDLAKYLIWLSEMLTETDQLEEALESCREAVDIFEKLVADFPEVPEYRENLAETYRNLGDVLEKMGRLEDSLQAYQKAEEMEKEVVTEETEDSNE
jgi:tetratricopeptide (TPR) repeat protein